MRIKLDENIPVRLVDALADLGHDVDTVSMEGLSGEPDESVWNATCEDQRFFITQDLDFSDVRSFSPGTHNGILVVRLKMPGRTALVRRVVEIFLDEVAESFAGSFVVLTDRKVRIRRADPAP